MSSVSETLANFNGTSAYTITVAQLAEQWDLKRISDEWHGAHPTGNGATKDGFVLNDDGTAWDRPTDRRYKSHEVAKELANIDPDQYEPCRQYKERNGAASSPPVAPPKQARLTTAQAMQRLQARGLTPETINRFHVKANANGQEYEYSVVADGQVQAIRYKAFDSSHEPKYRWPRKTKDARRFFLYGADGIPADCEHIYLVAGEPDVWIMQQAGLPAVSFLGGEGAVKPEYFGLIREYLPSVQSITAIYDVDEPGRKGMTKALEMAPPHGFTIRARDLSPLNSKHIEGFDLGNLHATLGHNDKAFRSALDKLPEWKAPGEQRRYSTDADLDGLLENISWHWYKWIPKGFVTMIAGFADAGKSTVAQDICKRLFAGMPWPDGEPNEVDPTDLKLLWIDTEASQAIFRQRLIDWGMPRGRFILPGDPLHDISLDNDEDWAWIKGAVEDFKPPLIVVDSLSGSHSKDENSNDGMKPIMKKLARLAQEYQIAVVVIHHLSKPAPGVPEWPITQPMLRGASSITQYCRSVIGCGTPNKQEPLAHGFMSVKLNLAQKPEPLGYTLTDQGPAWGDVPEIPQPRRAIDDAIDFLKGALKNGVRLSDDVNAEAKAHSIGYNALCDAKKALGIKARREGGKDGRWFLELPEWKATSNEEEEGAV